MEDGFSQIQSHNYMFIIVIYVISTRIIGKHSYLKINDLLLLWHLLLPWQCVALGGFTVFIGLSSATETLCSQVRLLSYMYYCWWWWQAYGAGNYRRVGVVLQRSILICYLALFIVATFLLNAESILLILYQSPCVAR